jgi:acylphosphatase
MKMKIKVKIIGPTVHNVGYRYMLLNEADNLGLKGFSARNAMDNGNQIVSILIEGDEETVAKFREFVQSNRPETAEVREICFEDYEGHVESVSRFAFRFQSMQVVRGVNSILKIENVQNEMLKNQGRMLDKQDQMLDRQDRMLDKQDQMLDRQDRMLDKQDQMLDKQDRMLDKQDQMLDRQDRMLDKQDQMLDRQDRMLDKQDRMIEKQDQMLEKQDESVELLKGVKDDTSAIRYEIHQSASSTLEEKYEQLSREIAEIKASISEIKAKVS